MLTSLLTLRKQSNAGEWSTDELTKEYLQIVDKPMSPDWRQTDTDGRRLIHEVRRTLQAEQASIRGEMTLDKSIKRSGLGME
jgi:hypothetical protein